MMDDKCNKFMYVQNWVEPSSFTRAIHDGQLNMDLNYEIPKIAIRRDLRLQ
jgi:hypothetical protein